MRHFHVSTLKSMLVLAFMLILGAADAQEKDKGGKVIVFGLEKANPEQPLPKASELAEALKKRIDPGDLYAVTIRPAGDGRIEIVLPGGKKDRTAPGGRKDLTPAEIEHIKSLVARVGSLEFAIIANGKDDSLAIEDARRQINEATEDAKAELAARQKEGQPPPGPIDPKTGRPKTYVINLAGRQKSEVAYRWVEVGPGERRWLNLDNAARDERERSDTWRQAAENRGRATTLQAPKSFGSRPLMQDALFYSRQCLDPSLSPEDQRQKAVEYFVLVREPEIDPKTGKATRLTGVYLLDAKVDKAEGGHPAVDFTLNAEGAALFSALTSKNVPDKGGEEGVLRRHLAIILDGRIISAPTINSKIGAKGMILGAKGIFEVTDPSVGGTFTKEEVERLVEILRSGALPARLRPIDEKAEKK